MLPPVGGSLTRSASKSWLGWHPNMILTDRREPETQEFVPTFYCALHAASGLILQVIQIKDLLKQGLPSSLCTFSVGINSIQHQCFHITSGRHAPGFGLWETLPHPFVYIQPVPSEALPARKNACAGICIQCTLQYEHKGFSLAWQEKALLHYLGFWGEGEATYTCKTKPEGYLTSTAKSNTLHGILPEITWVR